MRRNFRPREGSTGGRSRHSHVKDLRQRWRFNEGLLVPRPRPFQERGSTLERSADLSKRGWPFQGEAPIDADQVPKEEKNASVVFGILFRRAFLEIP